jgi:hypothetical protein
MPDAPHRLTPEAQKKRAQRSVAIALGLAAFMLVVFLVTILKISGNIGASS